MDRVERRGLINPTYHTTLESALTAALERAVHAAVVNSEITTLKEFAEQLRTTREEFTRLLEPLCVDKKGAT